MAAVIIIDPSADWPQEYRSIAIALRSVVGDTALTIDHVGSTSVSGLPAKDVIDLQVTVVDEQAMRRACALLHQHGYPVNPDGRDHPVDDEESDASAWHKGYANEKPGERRCNIHVRVLGRPNQIYALLFRDYLRTHPATARAYARFKVKAAALLPQDSATYADLKDPVCDLIYLPAKVWASATSWSPGK